MGPFQSPLLSQIFVISGVLSVILSCGLGLGHLSIFLEQHPDNDQHPNVDTQSYKYIETAGEIAFLPSIVIIPFIMQKKGRRIANLATILPLSLSWFVSFDIENVVSAVIFNVLHNISLGGAVAISSVIISEYCDPNYRGIFLMLETAMLSLGVLLSHVLGMFSLWHIISTLGVLTSTVSLIVVYLSPESPYWLISQGHLIKGTESFYWLRGAYEGSLNELDVLLISQKRKLQLKALKPIISMNFREEVLDNLKSLLKADFLKPLSIMILLFSFVGFGGENLASSYSLKHIFHLTNGKYIGTIILDVLTLICSLTACVLIQVVKRRTLFLFTGSFSIIFLVLATILLLLQTFEMFSKEYLWLILSFVTGFVMFMSLGTTALPLSLLGEIFPMSYKGVGSSLTCAYLWAFGNNVLKSIPSLTRVVGVHGVLLFSIVSMIIVLVIINKVMPDTDNKTLLDIEKLMQLSKVDDYKLTQIEPEDNENFDGLRLFIEV